MFDQGGGDEEDDDVSFYVQANSTTMLKPVSGSSIYHHSTDGQIRTEREPSTGRYVQTNLSRLSHSLFSLFGIEERRIRRPSIVIREHQLSSYPINYDPSPQIIHRRVSEQHQPLIYKQDIAVRYLCPPTPPPPAPLIIREVRAPQLPPLPPSKSLTKNVLVEFFSFVRSISYHSSTSTTSGHASANYHSRTTTHSSIVHDTEGNIHSPRQRSLFTSMHVTRWLSNISLLFLKQLVGWSSNVYLPFQLNLPISLWNVGCPTENRNDKSSMRKLFPTQGHRHRHRRRWSMIVRRRRMWSFNMLIRRFGLKKRWKHWQFIDVIQPTKKRQHLIDRLRNNQVRHSFSTLIFISLFHL